MKPPPVAVITTYCLPSLPMYVIGAECAPASIFAAHNSLPDLASKARKRLSSVAPIKTNPLAVARETPRLGLPVFCFSSGNPSGIANPACHTICAVLTLAANKLPQGGCWQGQRVSGFQNRPTGPSGLTRDQGVREPSVFFFICPMPPKSCVLIDR